jgi:hypothetical protein
MPARRCQAALRRREAQLWTGRAAHLVGGTLDLLQAVARYGLARRREPAGRRRRAEARRRSMHPSKR